MMLELLTKPSCCPWVKTTWVLAARRGSEFLQAAPIKIKHKQEFNKTLQLLFYFSPFIQRKMSCHLWIFLIFLLKNKNKTNKNTFENDGTKKADENKTKKLCTDVCRLCGDKRASELQRSYCRQNVQLNHFCPASRPQKPPQTSRTNVQPPLR